MHGEEAPSTQPDPAQPRDDSMSVESDRARPDSPAPVVAAGTLMGSGSDAATVGGSKETRMINPSHFGHEPAAVDLIEAAAGLATAGLCFAAWAMMGLGMGVAACSVAATGAAAGMAADWGAVARAVPSVEPGELSTNSPVDDCLSGPTDSGWSCLGLRFIVFNFWQQRLPGETTRKPRLPGRHWSVALGISRLVFGVPSS